MNCCALSEQGDILICSKTETNKNPGRCRGLFCREGEQLKRFLESLTRLELRKFRSLNLDGFAGLGIATGTGGTFSNTECAESDQLDLVALLKSFLCRFNKSLQCNFSLSFRSILTYSGFISSDIKLIVDKAARLVFKRKESAISQEILGEVIRTSQPSLSAESLSEYERIRERFENQTVQKKRRPIGFLS